MISKQLDKVRNAFLLFICFLYYLIRGKATKKITEPKKIIVIQIAKLGDMVCTTPMFRAIKRRYPNVKLYLIGNSINKDLLLGNHDVDEYIDYTKNNLWELIKKIREEKIDFACQATPSFYFLSVMFLSGIPSISTPIVRNGFCPWETKSYIILRNFVISCVHKMGSYAPREYLRLLEPIGIQTDKTKKYLYISKPAQYKIDTFLNDSKITGVDFLVGISPAAGNRVKQWLPQRFAEVANYLSKKYKAKILIIGGKGDKKEVEEMKACIQKDVIMFDVSGLFTLEELKASVNRMKLFISVDTGPIYIAEAFSVPTIDVTGPIDEKEQPPISNIHRVVNIKDRKKPELSVMNAQIYDKIEARRQVEEIKTEMVTEEIDNLITYLNNHHE